MYILMSFQLRKFHFETYKICLKIAIFIVHNIDLKTTNLLILFVVTDCHKTFFCHTKFISQKSARFCTKKPKLRSACCHLQFRKMNIEN